MKKINCRLALVSGISEKWWLLTFTLCNCFRHFFGLVSLKIMKILSLFSLLSLSMYLYPSPNSLSLFLSLLYLSLCLPSLSIAIAFRRFYDFSSFSISLSSVSSRLISLSLRSISITCFSMSCISLSLSKTLSLFLSLFSLSSLSFYLPGGPSLKIMTASCMPSDTARDSLVSFFPETTKVPLERSTLTI